MIFDDAAACYDCSRTTEGEIAIHVKRKMKRELGGSMSWTLVFTIALGYIIGRAVVGFFKMIGTMISETFG